MFTKVLRRALALVLALILCAAALPAMENTALAASDGMIRVLLTRVGTSRTSISFKTNCAYAIGSASGEKIPSGSTVKILLSGGDLYLSVDGEARNVGAKVALYRLAKGNSGATFTAPSLSNTYCGDLIFSAASGAIQPVLRIYIEDYLYGVVAYEMSDSFPLEALKAQAICARTYAMRLKKTSGSYDVTDNTTHQVFKGYNGSWTNVISAVNATKGQCLTYGGAYAGCWYTASNGGQTESTRNIWGSNLGYSVVKDDPYDFENPSSTKKTHTISKNPEEKALNSKLEILLKNALAPELAKLGLSGDTGDIKILEVVGVKPHTPKYAEPSRTFTKLRFALRVSSLNDVGERETTKIAVDLATYDQLRSALSLDISSTTTELVWVEETNDGFELSFTRYGHGVGLSQRGAQQMAKAHSMSAKQILAFYFPGTALETKDFVDSTATGGSSQPETDGEYATLQYGDKGDAVKKLQARLKELGYFSGSVAGNYLAQTQAAVKAFQSANGMTADGIATPEVQKKLFANTAASKPTPAPTDAPEADTLPDKGNVKVQAPAGTKLRVYSSPRTTSLVKGSLSNGTIVYLHAVSGQWAAISSGSLKGYVNKNYLAATSVVPTPTPKPTPKPTEETEKDEVAAGTYAKVNIPASAALRVYKKPSTVSARVGALKGGTTVRVYGTNSAWAAVSGGGIKGYVSKKYLAPVDSAPTAKPTTAPTAAPTPTPVPENGETAWRNYARVTLPSAGKLGLRTKPEAHAGCVAYLENGTRIKTYTRIGDWARVTNGAKTGYVPVKYITVYD